MNDYSKQNLSSSKVQCVIFHISPRVLIKKSECVADDPWKVLVAVMLLNKTAGRSAVPIFFTLIERWPTPAALSQGLPTIYTSYGARH